MLTPWPLALAPTLQYTSDARAGAPADDGAILDSFREAHGGGVVTAAFAHNSEVGYYSGLYKVYTQSEGDLVRGQASAFMASSLIAGHPLVAGLPASLLAVNGPGVGAISFSTRLTPMPDATVLARWAPLGASAPGYDPAAPTWESRPAAIVVRTVGSVRVADVNVRPADGPAAGAMAYQALLWAKRVPFQPWGFTGEGRG